MKFKVYIEEIYPFESKSPHPKNKEAGTAHAVIEIGDLRIDYKNILYIINKKNQISIRRPSRMYGKGTPREALVPTVTFSDPEVFNQILEALKKDLRESL